MKLLSIIILLTLASCASRTSQEESQYNSDEDVLIIRESYGTVR